MTKTLLCKKTLFLAALVLLIVSLAGCGGGGGNNSNPGGGNGNPEYGSYLYLLDYNDKQIIVYKINVDGSLTRKTTENQVATPDARAMAVTPNGKYIYAISSYDKTVAAYRIGSDGVPVELTTPSNRVSTTMSPYSLTVSSNGTYLYVSNSSNAISSYTIHNDGTLTHGSDYSSNNIRVSVYLRPNNDYLYALDGMYRCVYGLSSASGGSPVDMSSAITPTNSNPDPYDIAVTSSGKYAYVTNGNNTITAYAIQSGGTWNNLGSIATGTVPDCLRVDPKNRYVYVCNYSSNSISAYGIGNDGSLTSKGAAATGNQPVTMAFDPDGNFVYVVTDDQYLAIYKINTGGSLTEITTAATRIRLDGHVGTADYADAMFSVKVQ